MPYSSRFTLMNYIIGIDGGGTKTIGLLANQDVQILARVESGPSNYHVVGEQKTKDVLSQITLQLLAELDTTLADRNGCCRTIHCTFCLGMAGLGRRTDQQVIGRICDEIGLPKNRILTHDAQIALVGGAGKFDGVIVISGTGSIAYGINTEGQEARAGGWGHLLGDEGSGYDIARRGLQTVARAADGREAPTQLTDLMLNTLGLQHPSELIRWVHTASKDQVAQLAAQVFAGADTGDSAALQILDDAADELTLAAKAVINQLGFDQPFDTVLSGGILTHQPTFAHRLRSRLRLIAPNANVGLPKNEPAYGAVLLAKSRFLSGL